MKLFVGTLILVGAIYAWMFISAMTRRHDDDPVLDRDL